MTQTTQATARTPLADGAGHTFCVPIAVSVEQTLWTKLAAVSVLAMLPVIVLGVVAQKHIVKGLTVGAVKGGGRR